MIMEKRVFTRISAIVFLLFSGFALTACGGSDDPVVPINIPTEDDECCNAEETFLAYTFLHNGYLKEIESLRDTIDEKYALSVYSRGGKLHAGYNDVFFALTKISNQGFVRDFSVTEISPVMTMTEKGMKHSTPTATESSLYDETFPAVQHAWISFVMSSSSMGYWELGYKATTQNKTVAHTGSVIEVSVNATGQEWIKSFKYQDVNYYLSLVNPNDFQTGINTIQAYVSQQNAEKAKPWPLADQEFTIEIIPTMPDMGNHSSPDNVALTKQESGIYEGKLNLTMTGLWDIHLVVKDKEGNIVAGGENNDSGYSNIYWSVIL